MKIHIANFLAETEDEYEVGFREDVTTDELLESWSQLYPTTEGARMTWDTMAEAITRLITIDGRRMTPSQFSSLIHGEWFYMEYFVKVLAEFIALMAKRAAELFPADNDAGEEPTGNPS